MPRVAHVVSSPGGVGGAEQVVASLVRGALERDWQPLILNPFSLDPGNSPLEAICRPAPYAGMRCRSVMELPGLRRWLGSTLREFGPDIVHAHLFHAEVATASIRLPRKSRSVLTHHHGDHLVYLERRAAARVDRYAGLRFDRVVAISEWVRNFLRGTYQYGDRKIELIRNGWEGRPRPHRGGQERPTVICVANFRVQKGHADLLNAFARVRSELPEARLVLVGEGELHDHIVAMSYGLGIAGSVELRGKVDDVWPHLANADVFALSSLYEPLGIAVMEALAAGLPVISTAVGGLPELVSEGENGRLVRPGDTDGLARRLVELLRNETTRSAMGAAARAAAQKMHMRRTLARYFDLYEGLLAERSFRAQ